jgi:membrane fusion protein
MNGETGLFREQALTGATERVFGEVTAVLPPSGTVGALLSIACVAATAAVAFFVRMPLKIEAAGVLMPPGGLVEVVAVADGRIEKVHGQAMAKVGAGDPMFDIAVESAVVDGVASSRFRLRSSQREVHQLGRIGVARDRVFEEELNGLRQELKAVDHRRQLIGRQLAAQREVLTAAETRLTRHQSLAEEGHVSKDELDRQRELLLRDRATLSGIEQQAAALGVERQSLHTRIEALSRERDVSRAELALRLEQLSRDVESSASRSHYSVRSPRDGVIERLLVEPGTYVRKGQVLARLSRGQRLLEAWLYLPNSSVRSLTTGQSVELRLDAWPRSAFGTRTATVYFVSSIPISPTEVSAPLSVAVPVFEIRARLDRQPVPDTNGRWTIPPGTTFRAYVWQRQMRLYEWLFRNRRAGPAVGDA